MSHYVIKMPDIGEGIAEVELVTWRVRPGEHVVEDQILADVMTDKATVEIPSPVIGTILSLSGEPGQVITVGSELIRLEVKNNNYTNATTIPSPPTASIITPIHNTAPVPTQVINQPIASPTVRRRATQLGIALQTVSTSNEDGRITHEDLDLYITNKHSPPRASNGYTERHDEHTVPIIGMRRKIAQKMQEAKRRIPHFTYVEECDVTEIEALRARLNTRWHTERGHLTLLPLLMRAMVLALREYPQCNARFDDDSGVVTRYGAVHIGIATQTEAGLIVPVVQHAEARDLWSSAAEITRLAKAARAGKTVRSELSGSTITITSLGALGGLVSTPVINHPEVAIVGINRIIERPVIQDNAVVARKMMNLSSSFDHRVVDGQLAAEFIQSLRHYLESPTLLFVE